MNKFFPIVLVLLFLSCDNSASSSDEMPDILGTWYNDKIEIYGNSMCSGEPYYSNSDVECYDDGYYFSDYECYRTYLTFYADSTYNAEYQYCPTADFSAPDCVFESDYYDYEEYYPQYYTIADDDNPITGYSLNIGQMVIPVEVYIESNERTLSFYIEQDTTEYGIDDDFIPNQMGWWSNGNQCGKASLKKSDTPLNYSSFNNEDSPNIKSNRFKEHPFKILNLKK